MSEHQEHQDHVEPNGLDDRFADWVDGRLDEQARRELEAELARDPELRRQAEQYRATVQLVQGHLGGGQTDQEPPDDLVAAVLERVRRERAPLFRLIPMVASLATAAALVLLVVLLNRPSAPTPPKEVAKYEVEEMEEAEEEEVLDKADDRALRFKTSAKSAEPTKPDVSVDTVGQPKAAEEARKQTGEGKQVARTRVNEGLQKAPAPGKAVAPTAPAPTRPAPSKEPAPAQRALPGAGAEQQFQGRTRGQLKDSREDQGREQLQQLQLQELQRITTQVFQPPARQEQDHDQEMVHDQFFQKRARLKRGADKKSKADAKPMAQPQAQVPVVLVQLAGPTAAGEKLEFRKGQQQSGQGFLGYLQQQPQSWAMGNRVFHQARTEDLSRRALATLSRPQTERGAAGVPAPTLVQPGDQVLKVNGTSQEVEKLLQQLKDFLGAPSPQVVVQEAPVVQLPTGRGRSGAQDDGKKQQAPGEMSFYLVLRQAGPATRPRGERR